MGTFLIRPVLATTLLLFASHTTQAGLIVNEDTAWPTDPEVETFDPGLGLSMSSVRLDSTEDDAGDAINRITQTFTAPASLTLDKLYIHYRNQVAGRTIELRFFEVADPDPADPFAQLVEGTNLLTTGLQYTFEVGQPTTARNLEFDLTGSDELSLTAGQGYAFQIVSVDDDDSFDFDWRRRGTEVFAGGRSYSGIEPMAPGAGVPTRDMYLAIVAIPEPSALALASTATIAGLLRPRRKR